MLNGGKSARFFGDFLDYDGVEVWDWFVSLLSPAVI